MTTETIAIKLLDALPFNARKRVTQPTLWTMAQAVADGRITFVKAVANLSQ